MDGDAPARAKIMEHWRASEQGDSAAEHAIYATDAILDYWSSPAASSPMRPSTLPTHSTRPVAGSAGRADAGRPFRLMRTIANRLGSSTDSGACPASRRRAERRNAR